MAGEIVASYTSVSSVSAQDEESGCVDNRKEAIVVDSAKTLDSVECNRKSILIKSRSRTMLLMVVGFIAVIVITTVVFFVVQFGSNRTKNRMSRQQQFINDITTKSVFDKTTLLNEQSPQYRARQWMILNDTYANTLYKSIGAQRNQQNTKKIVQRFALAVIYYSMSLSNTNWMETMGSECVRNENGSSTWDGLNCNSDDELVAIWLGE
jgi:hypothetical protein